MLDFTSKMNSTNEHNKKATNFSEACFSFASGSSENTAKLKEINKALFDSEHPKKLESLSKYLMIKFLTVNKT